MDQRNEKEIRNNRRKKERRRRRAPLSPPYSPSFLTLLLREAAPRKKMAFTQTEIDLLNGTVTVGGILSVCGCLFLVGSAIYFRKLRHSYWRAVVVLALWDGLTAATFVPTPPLRSFIFYIIFIYLLFDLLIYLLQRMTLYVFCRLSGDELLAGTCSMGPVRSKCVPAAGYCSLFGAPCWMA